jgi:acyl-coenzyme A synthetase/AMP-(fatty) acid ligase
VVVKIVLAKGYHQKHMNEVVQKIVRQFKSELGEDMDIVIELVDQIPPTRIGKRRLVISNVTKVLP